MPGREETVLLCNKLSHVQEKKPEGLTEEEEEEDVAAQKRRSDKSKASPRIKGFTGTAVSVVSSWIEDKSVHETQRTPLIIFGAVSLITVCFFFPIARCFFTRCCKRFLSFVAMCFDHCGDPSEEG
mmetsp:Transcript_148939/g.270694  ORF Transcript_148939/g.270694 Transcript_148939/m.270694 type:complete len:126 (+) Transcript_148939:1042-1419(+)